MRGWLLRGAAATVFVGLAVGCSSGGQAAPDPEATGTTSAALKRLEKATGTSWEATYDATGRNLRNVSGRSAPILDEKTTAAEATLRFLKEHGDLFAMRAPESELVLRRERTTH